MTPSQGQFSFLRHPREEQPIPTKFTFLYVNVGRGHPFYLDGINDALIRQGRIGLVRSTEDVFDVSRGFSRLGWRAVHWIYRRGASPGLFSRLYGVLRSTNDYNSDSLALSLLGKSLRGRFGADQRPLIVSHPILVGIFRNYPNLIYQHGELVTPPEAVVKGAGLVMAPTEASAQPFRDAGYSADSVFVSGLCIEPALVKQAETAMALRRQRFSGNDPLTGAFYSSGAEPDDHLESISQASTALVSAGHRAIIIAERGKKLASLIRRAFSQADIPLAQMTASDLIPAELPAALLIEFASRREESTLTARLFPSYDFLVAPSHERTNWAVGLGLPMFVLEPCIGPYAPLNRDLLLDHKVAFDLTSREHVASFAERVNSLRHRGRLLQMAENGWGKYSIDGFSRIADLLSDRSQT